MAYSTSSITLRSFVLAVVLVYFCFIVEFVSNHQAFENFRRICVRDSAFENLGTCHSRIF
jgi:hypothetical protein